MNCPKCNAEVRDDAKFCTKCGQKMDVAQVCPQCGASVKSGARFCTKCGSNLATTQISGKMSENKASTPQVAPDMNVAKGRIYWNVQPGQVARVISETEFESYNKIQGVIVPEGTTAYIRSNGHTIASIGGGAYDFVDATSSENLFRRGWQFIVNLFRSKKKNEEEPTKEELYLRQQNVILENAKKGAAFSVIILLDKAFPMMIGAKHKKLDDYQNFVPMKIQTKYLEMNVGVNAYFKITDQERFIRHYLIERHVLNTALIADEITDVIRVTLQDALYDVELSSNRVPKELHLMLKDRINAVAAESFFGLAIVRIVEVSAQSEDLERFAKISQELYLSEKELDYLRRTNDFKNRLADTINEQELHQATTEQEFKHQLNIINRNKHNEELLNEDELRKFEHLLINERIVREAKNNAERDAALTEIAKTGLVRQEELSMLAHEAKTRNYQRGMALAMMQLRDGIEFERIRLEGEAQKAEMIIRKELELQGMRDDYQDSRFYKELDKQRAIEDAKLDLQQRQRDMDYNDVKRLHDLQREDDEAQFRQMMAMQEMEERSKENQRKHDAEMELNRLKNAEEMERMKWENAQHLSDEKVWALNGGEGAVAYAQNKYNADRERETAERLEAQRKEQDARLDAERAARDADQRDTKERMFEMMNNMMAMTSGIQNQKMEDKERQLRERDERIRRQEGRMDTAYDRALDYTTREATVSHQQSQQPQYEVHVQPVTSSAAAQPMVSKNISTIVCPECGEVLEMDSAFCDNCGSPIKG